MPLQGLDSAGNPIYTVREFEVVRDAAAVYAARADRLHAQQTDTMYLIGLHERDPVGLDALERSRSGARAL